VADSGCGDGQHFRDARNRYGTFQLTDETIDAPVEGLEAARVNAGIEPERFRLLRPGQVWSVEARAVA